MKRNAVRLLSIFTIIACLLLPQAVIAQDSASDAGSDDLGYLKGVMDMIKDKYRGQVSDEQLIEGALKGMFNTMDPYTEFYTMEEAESFLGEIEGKYSGIGVMLYMIDNYSVISKVFDDSPAQEAGLLAGDKIASVDGKSVVGASLDEVSSLIKGTAGSKVTIGIVRDGISGIRSFEVTRAQITINPVSYEIRGDMGYIKLDSFNSNASEYIDKALADIDNAGVKKIILDLRDNPGGEVGQAVAIARRFVPAGLITRLDFKSEEIPDTEYYSYLDSPKYRLAVLVNENSASAAEILAGAIQDTKAGMLIGNKTFGKAKVQSLMPILTPEACAKYEKQLGVKIADAYQLMSKYGITPTDDEIIGMTKITTGEYTTPKGRMIDLQGLMPDVFVGDPEPVNGVSVSSIQKLKKTVKPVVGDESVDVYNAEKLLKALGYDVDEPDMNFDEKTSAAISEFQRDNGLYSYGVLDFTTQQALNDSLIKLETENDRQYAKALQLLKD